MRVLLRKIRQLAKKWTDCQGTYTFPNGRKYTGEWKDGERHGQGIFRWPDGPKIVSYVGEYKDGKRHGQGTMTLSDGGKYVGEWKDGKGHGQGTMTQPDGKVVKGIWKDGELVEVQ